MTGPSRTPPPNPVRHPIARLWRLARLGVHLVSGLATVATIYPLVNPARRARLKQRWSQKLLRILGIHLRVHGHLQPGTLLVANHISWIDIFVINAATPTGFVSKAEVRGWPAIGWLAEKTDTLFIERGRRHHVQHIAHAMAERLTAGQSIAFFPEGTTTDGSTLLPFHAGLFQPAISARVPVQPVAIRYLSADGQRSPAPAYAGNTTVLECLWATVGCRGLEARLDCLAPQPTEGKERRDLARNTEAVLHERLGVSATSTRQEPLI